MPPLARLGCLLLFWNIATVTSVVSFGDNKTSDFVDTQDKLLKTQIEIIHISAGNATNEKLDDLKERLSVLEEEFKKLNQLSDIRREHVNGSCDIAIQMLVNHYSSIDSQLKSLQLTLADRAQMENNKDYLRDIVEAVRSKHFKMANEKLNEMGDLTIIPKIVHEVYAKSENNFGLLVGLSKALTKITPSYEVLKSLYHEMQKEGHDNPIKLITLVEAFESEVMAQHNDPDDIKLNAIPIINELENTIKTIATQVLVTAMKSNDYSKNSEVYALADALSNFRPALSDEVMKSLVDGAFETVETNKILKYIVSHSNTSQAISGVNALFWKIKATGYLNSTIVLNLASSLSKLQARTEFAHLSQSKKDEVNNVVKNIPACARNAVFSESVCLWSKGTDSYLVAAHSRYNYDKVRRNIFTTISDANDTSFEINPLGTSWKVVKIDDTVLFKSIDYSTEYLYAAEINYNPELHYVFNWIRGDNTDIQSAFEIELAGDQCYLKSVYFNEYLYASDVKYKKGNDYAYVFTRKLETKSKNFLWEILKC